MKHKLIYIRWCDACSDTTGWKNLEDAIEWANGVRWLVETTGWVIKETKEYILLAQQRGDWTLENPTYQYANFMKIPKTWIKLRIDLSKHI
jgi:hypothetical protein